MINYDAASATYDNTRSSDERVILEFAKKVDLSRCRVLDFGCGTGNYLRLIREMEGCVGSGVEPSSGMREKAIAKNPGSLILEGSHESVPFPDAAFDFVFMTDVIHHVPDLVKLFGELERVLEKGGLACVETQSWPQIEARWYNRYFPSLALNEMRRYPDIDRILVAATKRGFSPAGVTVLAEGPEAVVTGDFVRNVEEKNYSMFRSLPEREFSEGLETLKKDLGKTLRAPGRGTSLVWLKKAR